MNSFHRMAELMSPQPQTYTPAQYLEAGYRAEMAGERERAAQYYSYLADAFADAPEGQAARAGLERLGFAVPARPQPHAGAEAAHDMRQGSAPRTYQQPSGHHHAPAGPPHKPAAQPHAPAAHRQAAPPAQQHASTQPGAATQHERADGPRIRLGELASQNLTSHRPSAHADRNALQQVPAEKPSQDDDESALRLPEVVARRAREMAEFEGLHFEKHYRGARLLAHIFVWFGWITVAGGLAFAVLATFGSQALASPVLGLPGGIVAGLAALVAGCALALGGQVALATFDQAQSMREIGIMLRARMDV